MTVLTKRLIFTATVFGATLFTIYKVKTEQKEEKYTEVPTPDHPSVEQPKKESKIKESYAKVKAKVIEKYAKAKAWAIVHQEEINLLHSVIALAASVYTLKSAISHDKLYSSMALPAPDPGKEVTAALQDAATSVASYSTCDVRPGNIVVGEWDQSGEFMHFSVV